ncbi:hypothetical protein BS78_10G027000 [Paspalum vaginatum]|nr:hypothetical protein BS78_10G027000 [Paspalum vaginatum]
MRYFSSFVAPDLPEMGPGRCPDWIFLSRRAFISPRLNWTVAHGPTSDGTPVQVSLFAADPPAVSHLRVHCPGIEEQFHHNPAVAFSRDALILFDVTFDNGISDYFIYRAGSKSTSLVRIDDPEPNTRGSGLFNTGLVCCGADHFAVAALFQDLMADVFKLSVFSSRTGVWTTKVVPLEPSSELLHEPNKLRRFWPDKVIPLKDSFLGWVDMWRGILLYDVLSDDPKLHYIPLPEPMPGNEGLKDQGESTFFRDVIGCGEVIKFVEVDYQYDGPESTDPNIYIPDDRCTAVTWSGELD